MEAAGVLGSAGNFRGVEKRGEQRRKMLKGATLHFNKGFSSLECVVRDISASGARIQMGETVGVPTRFVLSIAGEDTRIEASVRWRGARNIGLTLLLRSQ